MFSKLASTLFKSERQKTDESLIAERNRATQSLKSATNKSRGATDNIVRDERSSADQLMVDSRNEFDESRAHIPSQLNEERRQSDIATDLERTRLDAALLEERRISTKLINQVVLDERHTTDINLLFERNTTDLKISGTADKLSVEVSAHAVTKTSLTSRDEFLAIVSHDLRNPIGAVASYADLLIENPDGNQLGPKAKKYARAIKRNAEQSLRMIADLLDVERIAQDKLTLKITPVLPGAVLDQAVETHLSIAKDHGVTITKSDACAGALVHCDHDRIVQTLGNLLGNALKFTPGGGTIELAAQVCQEGIEFSVSDSGPGIPESKRAAIFERFAQLRSKDRDGLGLGLYISKMLVEAHGGRLWVESEHGHGSCFKFVIPLKAKAEKV